jgi:hypothetical protein
VFQISNRIIPYTYPDQSILSVSGIAKDIVGVSHTALTYLTEAGAAKYGLRQLHAAGKCAITVYDPYNDADDVVLFRREYDKSPFILGPCSDAYLQMLTQAATTYPLNSAIKYIYSCVISMDSRAVKPVCQVSFDVGFTQDIITNYIAHSLARFACDDWQELTRP